MRSLTVLAGALALTMTMGVSPATAQSARCLNCDDDDPQTAQRERASDSAAQPYRRARRNAGPTSVIPARSNISSAVLRRSISQNRSRLGSSNIIADAYKKYLADYRRIWNYAGSESARIAASCDRHSQQSVRLLEEIVKAQRLLGE